MTLVGKFALVQASWGSSVDIFRIEGETEKTVQATQWIEYTKSFHNRIGRVRKGDVTAYANTFEEAKARVAKARKVYDEKDKDVIRLSREMADAKRRRNEAVAKALKGESDE